mmetsp:Transcript_90023/g.159409  ORF Transcript_90023/g.159409 Transcript_90023/m.159409 type:complete len:927 (+) Transcript_90023:151-2931(+)
MQTLPAKDQAVFRSIVKFYETKQYKKGVKAADSILKKHGDHGETLCMKGLTLSYLDKKSEAYDLVRKGLKNHLQSHVCWHVYGLLYRQDREYSEAVKCYRQALKYDTDNIQILRDLSLLQIHRRDLHGFADTRRKLLQVKPSNRLNWIGYAIAEHLCESFEFAWTCLDNYEKTFKDESVPDYEISELFMYKASIMEEAGKFEEALECLKQHEKQIVDKLGMYEMEARLCMFLERFDEASEIYRRLVRINPEHHIYILGYMANQTKFHRFWPPLPPPRKESDDSEQAPPPATITSFPQTMHPDGMPIWGWLAPQHAYKPKRRRVAIGRRQHKRTLDTYTPLVEMTGEEQDEILKFFDGLISDHPRSDSLQRLLLFFITGDRFEKRMDKYLRARIRKGIPSMFRMIRPLYFQEGKAQIVEKLFLKYVQNLSDEEVPWFGPAPGEEAPPVEEIEEERPSSLLFAYMVTAEHFDFVGETAKALEHVDKAIEHTPTFVEIYSAKARIYKHAGDLAESAKWFDEVRSMDLADRFLNTQCVRALLRVDDVQTGMEKALLFSKEPDSPEAANLHDMQCMWYESAVGRSYTRQKNYGKALKKFNETFKHFNDIAEDQFDFHNYCLRKTTLKTYVAMLRMQDRLFSHKFYRRAAKDAIKIYLELYDLKLRGEGPACKAEKDGDKEAELSAEEKRRLKHKKKRESKKAEEEKAKQVVAAGGKPKKVDDDPEGEKLLEKEPLEEASKLVKSLVSSCKLDPATHVMMYELSRRQGKHLHCLQALIQLWELTGRDLTNHKLIAPLAHFCFAADLEDKAMHSAVREVILSEVAPVLEASEPFKSVEELRAAGTKVVDGVEARLKDCTEMPLAEVMASLKCLKFAGRDMKPFLETWRPEGAFSLKESKKMLEYLKKEYGEESSIFTRYKTRTLEIFPLLVIK